MTVRVSDPVLSDQLAAARGAVAVEGPDGEPLGTFSPLPADPLPPSVSEDELLRRLADPTRGYTTEQVLRHLRSL